MTANSATATTVDAAEISRFSAVAADWWDETGPFAPLHWLNPVRLTYIRARLIQHFARDGAGLKPFTGLTLLDIGCGGGLTAEPMTRLGAGVTGIDADAAAIAVAKDHAAGMGLAIDYRAGAAEDLQEAFDIVLALEIIEHVSDPEAFIANLKRLLKPGGILILSTLNRTPQSYALGIVAAERVLRWVPRGTHEWKKFIRPSELGRLLRAQGLTLNDLTGMTYDPLRRAFALSSHNLAVNYLASATV